MLIATGFCKKLQQMENLASLKPSNGLRDLYYRKLLHRLSPLSL